LEALLSQNEISSGRWLLLSGWHGDRSNRSTRTGAIFSFFLRKGTRCLDQFHDAVLTAIADEVIEMSGLSFEAARIDNPSEVSFGSMLLKKGS
jgi:hypothetical protein